jgi:transcriptional regulator with XRE-family HTH domain
MKPQIAPPQFAVPHEMAFSPAAIVAQNLLIARTALNLTQHQLADASGISRATIAQLEAGVGDPRLSTLELLAARLHIPAHFLLLDQASFRALAEVMRLANSPNAPAATPTDEIARTLHTGGVLNRLRAAALGLDLAQAAGLTEPAHQVGAAIGAARLAERGSLLGAHLAHWLERFKPKGVHGTAGPFDDSDLGPGEGI